MRMPDRLSILLFAALSVGAAPRPAAAEVLYAQPPVDEARRVGLGFFSHGEPGARRDYRHADDFRLAADATVSTVRWWGLVDGTRTAGLGNLRGFTLRILEVADGGTPGSVVLERALALADTAARATGRRGSGIDEASTASEYVHEARIEPSVPLRGGQAYFLEITADLLDPAADNWQWQDGQTRNGVSYSFSYRKQRWLRVEDTDSAFTLTGERSRAVP